MENGQLHDDKLFRAVHDRLSDYEAPANGADWDAMSRSLDSLPKTARFQWKISLNSILVILGVTGLSVIGYAVAAHSGNSNSKQPIPQVSAPMNPQPQNTSVASNSSSAVNTNVSFDIHQQTNVPAATNGVSLTNNPAPTDLSNGMANNNSTNQDGMKKVKRHGDNGLFFGDQIDPKKGFIYNSQENKDALTIPVATSNANVFYDVDNNGQIKKIIHKDSSTVQSEKKSFSDTLTNNKTGAPTNGDASDFGPHVQE